MDVVGRDLWRPPGPNPLLEHSHLEQVVQELRCLKPLLIILVNWFKWSLIIVAGMWYSYEAFPVLIHWSAPWLHFLLSSHTPRDGRNGLSPVPIFPYPFPYFPINTFFINANGSLWDIILNCTHLKEAFAFLVLLLLICSTLAENHGVIQR